MFPFKGFICSAPFWIITEFPALSSLAQCLSNERLSGTDLTIVGFAISFVLNRLHKINYSLPHLNSHNIFITDGNFPKVTAFQASPAVVKWMAPEVCEGNDHSIQSDIFNLSIVFL
jgi:hypothetical protein